MNKLDRVAPLSADEIIDFKAIIQGYGLQKFLTPQQQTECVNEALKQIKGAWYFTYSKLCKCMRAEGVPIGEGTRCFPCTYGLLDCARDLLHKSLNVMDAHPYTLVTPVTVEDYGSLDLEEKGGK